MESSDGCTAAKRLLEDVANLLKDPQLAFDFARRGINTSLALVAVQGTISYLGGEKRRAAEDLTTAGEEIRARIE